MRPRSQGFTTKCYNHTVIAPVKHAGGYMNVSSHFGVQEQLYSWNIFTKSCLFSCRKMKMHAVSPEVTEITGKAALECGCYCYLDPYSWHFFINVRFYSVGLPKCWLCSCIVQLFFAALYYGLVVQILQKWPKTYLYLCWASGKHEMPVITLLCKSSITIPCCCRLPWCLSLSAASFMCGCKDLWKWLKNLSLNHERCLTRTEPWKRANWLGKLCWGPPVPACQTISLIAWCCVGHAG